MTAATVQRPPEDDVGVVPGGRRRRLIVGGVLAVVLLAAVAFAISSRADTGGLAPFDEETELMLGVCSPRLGKCPLRPENRIVVDQLLYAGFNGLDTTDERPVRLRSARIVNVPDGMKIISIKATSRGENDGQFYIGWKDFWPGGQRHPLDEVTIEPGNDKANDQQVYLQVEFTITKPGTYQASDLRVDYEGGSRTYPDFAFGAVDVQLTRDGPFVPAPTEWKRRSERGD